MTRKCAICKETNYKNAYSFFSAPKDPETRQKWSDAINIENYVVSDETYVCSRHFRPCDIITHWVSGVPPHVVTIKYKKCRLRPGAVPSTSCESMNNLLTSEENDNEDLEVNRAPRQTKVNRILSSTSEIIFLPKDDERSMENSDVQPDEDNFQNGAILGRIIKPSTYSVIRGTNDYSSEDTNNSALIDHPDNEQEEMATIVNLQDGENFVYAENESESQMLYVQDGNTIDLNCVQEEEIELVPDEKLIKCDEYDTLKTQVAITEDENTSMDMWETLSNDNTVANEIKDQENFSIEVNSDKCENASDEIIDPLSVKMEHNYDEDDDNAFLFEDLMDIFTDVQLPTGWSSMVSAKGHGTMVIYVYMKLTKSGMPYAEKQVFIKSDMIIRCGAANKELNPQMHNLVREGKNPTVSSLSDVEEFIEEFDQRIVCEGCANEKTCPEDIENSLAYRDVSTKWRHVKCPIIVNNGTSRCSKCSTLDNTLMRTSKKRQRRKIDEYANALMKKEKTIRVLHALLKKLNRRNQRFESMRESIEGKFESVVTESREVLSSTVDKLNMPKIQKIMVKECLKASVRQSGKPTYSEAWVFLCLLLYIESPRIYRFMLKTKYMTLPSMKIIRRYLRQIKTDEQFYNFFQRTVEPFRLNERENETEPT